MNYLEKFNAVSAGQNSVKILLNSVPSDVRHFELMNCKIFGGKKFLSTMSVVSMQGLMP